MIHLLDDDRTIFLSGGVFEECELFGQSLVASCGWRAVKTFCTVEKDRAIRQNQNGNAEVAAEVLDGARPPTNQSHDMGALTLQCMIIDDCI
jgi:hypothetical protein